MAGIVSKTKNFRLPNINPKTLEVVGKLIELGAKRNEVVEGLYKTKAVETLKLWGRALSRLKQDNQIIWSLLTRNDFIHSGADQKMLPDVIHELISTSPNTDIIVLFFEDNTKNIKAILYSEKQNLNIPSMQIKHTCGQLSYITLPHNSLIEAEKKLIEEIRAVS